MHICARGIDFASISTIFLFIFFFDLFRKDVQILIICFNLCSHCRYRYVHANPCFSQFLSLYFCILVLGVCQRSRLRDVLFCLTPPLFFSDVGGLKRVSRVEREQPTFLKRLSSSPGCLFLTLIAQSLVFCEAFGLTLCLINCVVCPPLMYVSWLPLCYPQTFLLILFLLA